MAPPRDGEGAQNNTHYTCALRVNCYECDGFITVARTTVTPELCLLLDLHFHVPFIFCLTEAGLQVLIEDREQILDGFEVLNSDALNINLTQ